MIYVDELLTKIVNDPNISFLNLKDHNVLTNMASAIASKQYITENQSKLLVKILRENQRRFPERKTEFVAALADPKWMYPFRHVEQVKTITIGERPTGEPSIIIEMAFVGSIKKDFLNSLTGLDVQASSNTKHYFVDLDEKNLVRIVDIARRMDFDIAAEVQTHYDTIKSWDASEYRNQFLVNTITNPNFQRVFAEDLGTLADASSTLIADRSLRYQYAKQEPADAVNLTTQLANRDKTRIWVNSAEVTISDLIKSLAELQRAPMLVVFDNWGEEKNFDALTSLSTALEDNGIDNVGVYFRMPNNDYGKKFNQLIADKKYNHTLCDTTQVAVVQSGKLPKFFLKNPWRPMSVIALETKMGLRHGKTSVYANCCDLIAEYADAPALIDQRMKWQ